MNAGRVELDLVAVGKDQVSAMLRGLDAQAKKTAAELKKTGESAEEAGSKVSALGKADALKAAAGPVNKLREVFENLRGNAGFIFGSIAGAIGLVGGALDALAGDLLKGSVAMQRWDAARKTLEDGAKRTEEIVKGLRAELDRLRGVEGPTKLDEGTDAANKRLEELRANIVAGTAATKELKKSMDLLALVPGGALAGMILVEDIRKSNRDIVDLKKQEIELNNLLLEGERERTIEALRSVAALQAYLRGDKAIANDEKINPDSLKVDPTLVPGYVAPGSSKPRGGGGGGPRVDAWKQELERQQRALKRDREALIAEANRDWDELFGVDAANMLRAERDSRAKLGREQEEAARKRRLGQVSPVLDGFGSLFDKDAIGDKLKTMTSDADAVAAAFDKIAVSSRGIEAVLPGLSGAFSQVSEIWAATDGSAESMAQGVLGSVDAIANAGAAWLKDEKARTRFLGAKELLLAAPLWFIDPAQAAVKTATGIGLLALGGGGGAGAGGGARSSSGGSAGFVPDRTTGGGQSGPMIVNISTFASDPHTMQRMIAQSRRGTASTGLDTRSAA